MVKNPQPTFPPLLRGHRLEDGKNPHAWAISRVAKGKLEAGDIVWSEKINQMHFSVVLEPDVERERCFEMLYLLMAAFGDAAGALCPPEISIQYRWPNAILMNGASIGGVELKVSDDEQDGIPDWMVATICVDIKPNEIVTDPGAIEDKTTFWDEGCGEINRTELIESVSRHMVNWIHSWGEEGFKTIHETWWGRVAKTDKLIKLLDASGDLIGIDENGNALVSQDGETQVLKTSETLEAIAKP